MQFTRRHTLGLFLAGAASPAFGQATRRAALPAWTQLSRVNGHPSRDRGGQTLFFSQPDSRILGMRWTTRTNSLNTLFSIPDPGNTIYNDLFRRYEVRGAGDLDSNPTQLEDFAWPDRARMREIVWTSFYGAADPFWDTLFAADHPDKEILFVPQYTTCLWLQPTNDTPNDGIYDFSVMDTPDAFLSNIITATLAQPLPIATTTAPTTTVANLFSTRKEIYLVAVHDKNTRPLYANAYLRILRSNMRDPTL